MNYIREINAFYDWLETNELSTSAISLWYALMHINNKTGWKNEFTVALSVLSIKSGLSPRAVTNARKELTEKGRIKWESRNGNQAAQYTVNSLVEELQELYADKVADKQTDKPTDKVADKQTDKPTDKVADISTTLTKLNINRNIINNPPGSEQEVFIYWNQKGIVKHPNITNNLRIALELAVKRFSIENIKTAINHYATMYFDSTYEFCTYKWTLEKFLEDKKGVTDFFSDGQKWLSYQNHLLKAKPEEPPIDRSNYKIKYVNED